MFSRTQRCGCFYVGVLVNVIKMRYTYDSLGRVTNRTVLSECDCVISSEDYTHDAAGNITDAPDSCFQYDINNRLEVFNCNCVSYDMDGNMLSNGEQCFTYDSANRLITADCHTYTYNAEDVRIRNLCERCEDTAYTYDTNCKLSKLLCKTTNGVATKYVYGRGLVGEEVCGTFKTYHFDCRGSTIAITDTSGNITDTFVYDTYGKLVSRTGTSEVIFGHNGRDGVVTDDNGLIYMRARYYSPEMKRFINADIVAGQISNAVTLNRFAYANGNPVSFVDPFGLSVEKENAEEYPLLLVLYEPSDFFRQAQDEREYLMSTYNSTNVLMIPISNKQEFFDAWEQAVSDNVQGISLIVHGGPKHIYPNENIMADEIKDLEKIELNFLRLLSCNGGHKDVQNNIANAFKSNHDISELYAMDGSLSFYPRTWYVIDYDYSKYNPRLAFKQDRFYKYASEETLIFRPNADVEAINIRVKRQPTGLYLVQ